MKKNNQYDELYKVVTDADGNASFPKMYLKERDKRREIEWRYNMLVLLLKEEGCTRVSQRIKDELKAQTQMH